MAEDPSFLHTDSEDSDQTGQMPRLIGVFAERRCRFLGFDVRRLIYTSAIVLKLITSVVASIEPRHNKTNKMSVRPAKTQISLGIRQV